MKVYSNLFEHEFLNACHELKVKISELKDELEVRLPENVYVDHRDNSERKNHIGYLAGQAFISASFLKKIYEDNPDILSAQIVWEMQDES